MKIIDTIIKLEDLEQAIKRLYKEHGQIFQQSFESLRINLTYKPKGEFYIFFDEEISILTAFEKGKGSLWECSIMGYPILFEKNINKEDLIGFLTFIVNYLKVTSLYFPLVYENYSITKSFKSLDNSFILERLPSPVIKEKDIKTEKIWDQVVKVHGRRSERQKRKFEKELHVEVVDNLKSEKIDEIITRIELNSWKHRSQQDMISRDQFNYYTNLIKSGIAQLVVAFKSETPVAFRIDSIVNKVLYTIKWSYDENYKKFSPGFYLLTVDLPSRYNNKELKYIDLFGSPDNLKDMIQSSQIKRYDIYYPKSLEAENYSKKRYEFDKKVQNNYVNKKGVKNLYINA